MSCEIALDLSCSPTQNITKEAITLFNILETGILLLPLISLIRWETSGKFIKFCKFLQNLRRTRLLQVKVIMWVLRKHVFIFISEYLELEIKKIHFYHAVEKFWDKFFILIYLFHYMWFLTCLSWTNIKSSIKYHMQIKYMIYMKYKGKLFNSR